MSNNSQKINQDEIDIDLRKVYSSLKKGMKWIIIYPIIFIIPALIYLLFYAKPVFTSETKILLAGSENKSNLSSIAGQFGFSLPMLSNSVEYLSIESIPEILSSRKLATSILETSFNSKGFDTPKTFLDILIHYDLVDDSDPIRTVPIAINYVNENIFAIEHVKSTSIFSLLVKSIEPKLSADISLAVIEELSNQEHTFNKIEQNDRKIFISERIKEIRNELFSAETKLQNFREQNLQISISPTLLVEQDRLEREIEVQTQIFISLKQQLEQVKIEEARNSTKLKIIDPPNIPLSPSKPRKKLIILFAIFMGFIVGCGYSIKKYYNN